MPVPADQAPRERRPHNAARQLHTICEALWDIAQACRDEERLTCDAVALEDVEPVFGLITHLSGKIAALVDGAPEDATQQWLDSIPLRAAARGATGGGA